MRQRAVGMGQWATIISYLYYSSKLSETRYARHRRLDERGPSECWTLGNVRGDSFRGVWTINPYAKLTPPAVIAGCLHPAPPRCRATPRRLVRPVPHNTLAAALLQRWLAPITAGRAPAQVPLLVIDASAWSYQPHIIGNRHCPRPDTARELSLGPQYIPFCAADVKRTQLV